MDITAFLLYGRAGNNATALAASARSSSLLEIFFNLHDVFEQGFFENRDSRQEQMVELVEL